MIVHFAWKALFSGFCEKTNRINAIAEVPKKSGLKTAKAFSAYFACRLLVSLVSFRSNQESLHLGGIIRKGYDKVTGEHIRYQEKRYFEYFGLANFEECKLVIKQPSAIVKLQFDVLAKQANVQLVSLSDFVDLVNN